MFYLLLSLLFFCQGFCLRRIQMIAEFVFADIAPLVDCLFLRFGGCWDLSRKGFLAS